MDALVCVWLNVRFVLFENKALIYANYSDTITLTMPNYLALLMIISLWSENIRLFNSTHRDLLISFDISWNQPFLVNFIFRTVDFLEKYDIFEASLSLSRVGKKKHSHTKHYNQICRKLNGDQNFIFKTKRWKFETKKNRAAHQHSHKQDNKSSFFFRFQICFFLKNLMRK